MGTLHLFELLRDLQATKGRWRGRRLSLSDDSARWLFSGCLGRNLDLLLTGSLPSRLLTHRLRGGTELQLSLRIPFGLLLQVIAGLNSNSALSRHGRLLRV